MSDHYLTSLNTQIGHNLLVEHLTAAILEATQVSMNSFILGQSKIDDSQPAQSKLSKIKLEPYGEVPYKLSAILFAKTCSAVGNPSILQTTWAS